MDSLHKLEEPLADLKARVAALEAAEEDGPELEALKKELEERLRDCYGKLTPWETTLVARHPKRPYTMDFIRAMMTDFQPVAGDRQFADDQAVVGGLALFRGRQIMVIGHQKGRDTQEKLKRNFGMPRPEGYRKALRLMKLAEKFRRPVLTMIDTPGAYPGLDAEERGQAEAIARNLREMARLETPIVTAVTGEGGSGGALALGVGDHILMLEYAIYSVISPEGCASILWRDAGRMRDAAEALKLTAADLARLGIVDEVVAEPAGGAHRDPAATARNLADQLDAAFSRLEHLSPEELTRRRYKKFRAMGVVAG